ncbi:MAG TPA: hypothetical protein VE860_03580 [Chthoniobacterales bacterium]|jgi:hypothetical protein|nr:hypothetical protein [Chthoniobacterales bacterium]
MAESQDERKRIAEELARTRVALSDQALLLRRNLDVGRRMSTSVREHTWGWVTFAAIFGWILSRLPARKKKIYIHATNSEKRTRRDGALLIQVWKGIWSIARPVLTVYFTKKIGQQVKIAASKRP